MLGSKRRIEDFGTVCTVNSKDTDPITVKWIDGHEHQVMAVSVADYELLTKPRSNTKSDGLKDYWSGTHCNSNNAITIRTRTDRQLLVSMYKQKKQVLQVRANKFLSEGEENTCQRIARIALAR